MEEGHKYLQLSVLTLTAALMLSSSMGGQPGVLYVGDPINGGFFMAANKTFPPESAKWIFNGITSCRCRVACFTAGRKCQAWSFLEGEGDSSECRIISEGPETTNLTEMADATYFFWQSSINGSYTWGNDSLLYVELNTLFHFQRAKEQCARIPGHRLVIVKSEETFDYVSWYQDPWVTGKYVLANLFKITSTSAEWGDGTIIHTSPDKVIMNNKDEDIFIFQRGTLHDFNDNRGPFIVLCQANPLGIEW